MVFDNSAVDSPTWGTQTYSDIGQVGERSGSVAVVPVGSVEQHGYHLPVGTDTILADAVSRNGAGIVADNLPVLVTPPVWSGLSPHHLDFGGTISLEVETMIAVLRDVAASILDNGFDALIFVNGHGGNQAILSTAVTKIGREFPDAQILTITYFQLAAPFIDEVRESEAGGMAHGGEFETSIMLHLRPDLVHEGRAEATYLDDAYELRGEDLFEGGSLTVYRSFEEYSDSGAIGDPALATAENGEILYERLSEEMADLLMAIHNQNR